jgi:hypothetical protein
MDARGPFTKLIHHLVVELLPEKRALTLWLLLCGFEVPQQPVEGLLIHTMGLPAPKVANVPRMANERRPVTLYGHHRVIDPDWKEDGRTVLAFPCQGGLTGVNVRRDAIRETWLSVFFLLAILHWHFRAKTPS